MSEYDKYTVALICPVQTEYVAAKAFLDEEHGQVELTDHCDKNTYTFGRIGEHNVVILSLRDSQGKLVDIITIGKTVRSFPNMRFSLIISVAGGAPSRDHDIRLGDVVVGSATYPKEPPPLIRTVMQNLEVRYKRQGHELGGAIMTIIHNNPGLQEKYQRPDSNTDKLYVSFFTHTGGRDASCIATCGDDKSTLVLREPRGADEDSPVIHYGPIASSKELPDNALERDAFAEKGVLCFALGDPTLMDNLPCLQVRGICGYSDTHNNRRWEGYAIIAAAAYAKDILNTLTPGELEAEREPSKIPSNVEEDVTYISKWLSPPDPSINLKTALDYRNSESDPRILQHPLYSTWKSKRNSFLWIHGDAGRGKTILSSVVVEDLQNTHLNDCLYFYFDITDPEKKHFQGAIRSLISQLYYQRKDVRKYLDSLHSDDGIQTSLESLCTTFQNMVQQTDEVWIVLDALDECSSQNGNRDTLLRFIQTIRDLQMNIHLLVTSRPEQDISATIGSYSSGGDIIPIDDNAEYETDDDMSEVSDVSSIQLTVETSALAPEFADLTEAGRPPAEFVAQTFAQNNNLSALYLDAVRKFPKRKFFDNHDRLIKKLFKALRVVEAKDNFCSRAIGFLLAKPRRQEITRRIYDLYQDTETDASNRATTHPTAITDLDVSSFQEQIGTPPVELRQKHTKTADSEDDESPTFAEPGGDGHSTVIAEGNENKLEVLKSFITSGSPFQSFTHALECLIHWPRTIEEALETNNENALCELIATQFDKVAIGEYSWLKDTFPCIYHPCASYY
ncbi:hypothetical protein F5Y04DRAFT_290521 [Hypomontagnella monticulosa]|nr:hypothetical protein F5Y04DRAFT_290521 [Hypomontagnella monticulosa]